MTGLVWQSEFANAASAAGAFASLPAGLDREVVAKQEGSRVVVALEHPNRALDWGLDP